MSATKESPNKAPKKDTAKNEGSVRKRRRMTDGGKKLIDKDAPKQPRTGYYLYVAERRAQFEKEHSDLKTPQINAGLAAEWRQLDEQQKQPFIERAAKDKEEFVQKTKEYRKTDTYKTFLKKRQAFERKRKKGHANVEDIEEEDMLKAGDIPIFSDRFLAYNRERETLLRKLRKKAVDLEDEEKHLKEHIAYLESSSRSLAMETEVDVKRHAQLNAQLTKWRRVLLDALKSLPIPGTKESATISNIDSYLAKVHQMSLEAPNSHQNFLAKVRDAMAKVTLP